ncbi:MAG: DNA mismatch repair protein MutL [Flavobacteriales bacterium]|jgi:DNA mismatch repair protein MutL
MADIIQLLPDHVANQIAAGEVVQRPASAVKELLENAIDSGANHIQLIIKDSGKTLIQVIDNGNGMSDTDARMCFERHATSKLKTVDDLYHIKTKGFRGEAMASIAAIAQVELKTRRALDELGSSIKIEGSEVKEQNTCHTAEGTNVMVKNLFFNVPARRNFLKSNQVELRHILDEFHRVVIPHHSIGFSLIHNGNELFRLPKSNLLQRITAVFGHKSTQRYVPIEEKTDIVEISGHIAKPEFARKTRGEQFIFVNNRFIKSNYLNHAVNNAFDGLLASEYHAGYFLFLNINPEKIDVNIHPTKTEIKFEDEKAIYAMLRSTVKRSLGQFNVSPSLDFDKDPDVEQISYQKPGQIKIPTIQVDPSFNPFEPDTIQKSNTISGGLGTSNFGSSKPKPQENWQQMFQNLDIESSQEKLDIEEVGDASKLTYQIQQKYIVTNSGEGLVVIDQQRAHFRILFETLNKQLKKGAAASQQLLFPHQMNLDSGEIALFKEIQEEVVQLGFDFEFMGNQMLIVNGVPMGVKESDISNIIEDVLDCYKHENTEFKNNANEMLAKSISKSMATKKGQKLNLEEMRYIVEQLFACQMPYHCPNGKTVLITINPEDLDKKFN